MSAEHDAALERMHTDASGVPGPGTEPGKVWLNSAEVVDGLIRDFAAMALRDCQKASFLPQIEFECRRLNGLFVGSSPSDTYSRGPWNRPDQIGQFVLVALQINGELHNGVRDAFMVFASELLRYAAESGSEFDATQAGEIDGLILTLRDALLGLTGVGR